jgi:hypothetical protein
MALPSSPFVSANSIFAGLSIIQLKLSPALSGVTSATTIVTKVAHGLTAGQQVIYVSGTGFTGLTAATAYYVLYLTADTFSLSATSGGSAISVGTSTVGVFQPVLIFEAAQLDDDPEQEVKSLARPDARGVLRNVRNVRTKAADKYTFGLDEVKRLLAIFSGSLSGRVIGTCTLWIPDLDDASGKCALKSEADFACTVTRDGKVTYGNSDFSKATIKIESNKLGDLTWTPDATA